MADYTTSSVDTRSAHPENAVDAQEWNRLEPLLTAEQLYRRFLWGIDLVSKTMNRLTGKYDRLESEDLKDMILRAISNIEMDSKIDIFPVKRQEKKPFDRSEMMDLGYIRANYRPILSVDKLSVAPGNMGDLMVVPPEWIARDNFPRGEIRIVPTLNSLASGGFIPSAGFSGSGNSFIAIMGGMQWSPSFWTLEYTTGFADGRVPRSLNDLIGCYAAIEALSLLATSNTNNSESVGMDGMSQSKSNAGPQIYDGRIKLLTEKRDALLKKFRAIFGNKFAISNV